MIIKRNYYALLKPVLLLMIFGTSSYAQPTFDVDKVYSAEEAHQAVAVDSNYFYAIASQTIGKYNKQTGKRLTSWKNDNKTAIKHLDSGVVVNGKLYAAHSNYPKIPMTSSVEIWDTHSLSHIGSHSFGILRGSLTWLDLYNGHWWGTFAHYKEFEEQTGKDNRWTSLVKFNKQWQPLESWVFPEEVLDKFGEKSNSGGSWGADGYLYISGHDLGELYIMKLPKTGSVLELVETVKVKSEGQGIAWDRTTPGTIYTIKRSSREVIKSQTN